MAKRRDARETKRPQTRTQRGGMGWLVLAVVVGMVIAGFALMPSSLREHLGLGVPPRGLGDSPTQSQDTSGSTSARSTELEARSLDTGKEELAAAKQAKDAVTTEEEIVEDTGPKDQERGLALLGEAEGAYKSFDWDAARNQARRILELEVAPATKVRAEDILRGADALEQVFTKLNTKDELQRAWDTHPQLVSINSRGQDTLFIPVTDIGSKQVPETNDPAGWIRAQLSAAGEVSVLLTSGAGTVLKKQDVSAIRPADIDSIMQERQDAFDQRLSRLQSSEMARDPLMWYEAAKYAYRNRLDDRVTDLLDKALELNPFLADAIREDKAQGIFLKMVQLMNKDNRAGAAVWMQQLQKYYQETTVYPQARAYYDGNMDQLATARREAEERRKAERQRVREEKRRRREQLAKADPELAAKKEPLVDEDPYEEPAAREPVSGNASDADQAMSEGKTLLAKAQSMPVSDERDDVYREAQKYFDKAMRIYEAEGQTDKMVQANQFRYACIKYRRAF